MVMPKERRISRWLLVFTLLLTGLLLFLAFRGVNWPEMLVSVRRGRLDYLVLAFATFSISYFARGLRWRVLLSAERLIAPLTVFWATVVGYLGNSFLPARSGELIRSTMIGRIAKINIGYVLATALTERLLDVVALVLISLAALTTLEHMPAGLISAVRVMAVVGAIGIGGLFVAPQLGKVLNRLIARLPLRDTWRAGLAGLLEQVLYGMRAFQHPRRAASFVGLTIVIWLIDGVIAIEVARAFQLALTLPQAMLLLASLGLASAIPSTPGYVGIYQFVAVTVLVPFGFAQSEALIYIIAFQAVGYLVVIIWGTIGLWRLSISGRPVSDVNQLY
jgi:uncharacterized protein (TIRG00374 family)